MNNQSTKYDVEVSSVIAKGLAGYVIKWRLAKDKVSAERIMLIISLVFFALSIYFFIKAANVL